MATYNLSAGAEAGGHPAHARTPYLVENTIDIGAVNSSAGTGIADVLEVMAIPPQSVVLGAGMEVITAVTSTGSPTFDLDITGGTANQWAAAKDTTAGYAALVAESSTTQRALVTATGGDTIDITCNTAASTAGVIRVWAIIMDVSGVNETATNS